MFIVQNKAQLGARKKLLLALTGKKTLFHARMTSSDTDLDSREMHSVCCFTDFGHSSADWAMFVNLDTDRAFACICNSGSKKLHIHRTTSWIELDVAAAEKWLDYAGHSNPHVPANLFKYFPDAFWQKNEFRGDKLHALTLMRMLQLEEPEPAHSSADKITAIVILVGLGLLSINWWVKLIDIVFTLRYFG